MSFLRAVAIGFSKYAVFSGRAQRAEFWYFVLFNVLANLVLGFLEGSIVGMMGDGVPIMNGVYSLIAFIPTVAVGVRRLHDLNRSGAWWFLWFLPMIGWLIMLIWYARPGTEGDNAYGRDPLRGNRDPDDFDGGGHGGDHDGGHINGHEGSQGGSRRQHSSIPTVKR